MSREAPKWWPPKVGAKLRRATSDEHSSPKTPGLPYAIIVRERR